MNSNTTIMQNETFQVQQFSAEMHKLLGNLSDLAMNSSPPYIGFSSKGKHAFSPMSDIAVSPGFFHGAQELFPEAHSLVNPNTQLVLTSLTRLLFVSIIACSITQTIYRLYFHPLRSFPGPILAFLTNWHKFYYNWYRSGLHSSKIKQWHSQYGPIIRIAPNELHFSDPDACRAIYTHQGLQKEAAFYNFMTEDSLVGQLDVDENKKKRRIFAGFFSANAVRIQGNTEGVLGMKGNQLVTTLRQLKPGAMVNITDVSKCFTYDIIKEVVLGPSNTLNSSSPDFKPSFPVANAQVKFGLWLVQQFSFLVTIVRGLPDTILALVSPRLLILVQEREKCCEEVTSRSRVADNKKSPRPVDICSRVIQARKSQSRIQISNYHLGMEIFDFLVAGTELPANAISFGIFHLARSPHIISRLREEMQQVAAGPSSSNHQLANLTVLEKLPFLTAVVKETLRLGNLVPGRLPRVVPKQGMNIAGIHVRGGTVVSASANLVHMNPVFFPEPEKFLPERWLVDESGGGALEMDLDRYLVAFSAGSRDCIGRYLAMGEVRIFFASLVLFFHIELADEEDRVRDLTWKDNIVASYDRDVRIVIRERV